MYKIPLQRLIDMTARDGQPRVVQHAFVDTSETPDVPEHVHVEGDHRVIRVLCLGQQKAHSLTAEEREALFARISLQASLPTLDEHMRADLHRLLRLAKLATPELIALGEAAVKYAESDEDEWDLKTFVDQVRAYAASVASIPTTLGVE